MTESRDLNKFLVRMPDGMRDRIAEVAKANNRSMNSEIVARLEASFSNAVLADTQMFSTLQESIKLTQKQNAMIAALLERLPDAD